MHHDCRLSRQSGLLLLATASYIRHASGVALQRSQSDASVLSLRGRSAIDTASCTPMRNMDTHFTVDVTVGTPPQHFDLVADTGSDGVIVQSCVCRQFTPDCKKSEDCFMGTGKSSTFVPPPQNASLRLLSFGSGDIVAAVATDVVGVGESKATMKEGLLLMVNRALNMQGNFEGILGMGVPSWVEQSEDPPKIKGADPKNVERYKKNMEEFQREAQKQGKSKGEMKPLPRFLEEAGVKKFSICMNDAGAPGVMRLNPLLTAPKMLKNIGHHHWSLDFQGISVGAADAPVSICDKSTKKDTQDLACAAIPDSGTTLMLGPAKQIDALYADLCKRWPRCNKIKDLGADGKPESAFRSLMAGCGDWIEKGEGLAEIPSIHLHLGGADGDKQTLELTSWSFIVESYGFNGEKVCQPLFAEWNYHSILHGAVWILGTPLFYQFQVIFQSRPTSIGFSDAKCGQCGDSTALVLDRGMDRVKRLPRTMRGKPRMPSIDPSQPL